MRHAKGVIGDAAGSGLRAQLDELAARLGSRDGPPVLFAAATGLRPGEWMALEQRDIDREARVVYVRRALRNGRLKSTKTEGSIRAVPLQAIALEALDQLEADRETELLFFLRRIREVSDRASALGLAALDARVDDEQASVSAEAVGEKIVRVPRARRRRRKRAPPSDGLEPTPRRHHDGPEVRGARRSTPAA